MKDPILTAVIIQLTFEQVNDRRSSLHTLKVGRVLFKRIVAAA